MIRVLFMTGQVSERKRTILGLPFSLSYDTNNSYDDTQFHMIVPLSSRNL